MLLSAPKCVFFRLAHFSNTYIHATLDILAFSGFVLRHTLISMFVKFSSIWYTDYGIQMLQILQSEHLFSWAVQRLSLLMSIFSVPQNKVAEIRGEKIGEGRLATSASLGPRPQPFS